MIKAAVLGATGYAGIELVRLLTSHPEVSIEILGSHSFAGQKISDVYKNFNHVLEKECEELDLDKVGACDVAFTALPHGASKFTISLYTTPLGILSSEIERESPAFSVCIEL